MEGYIRVDDVINYICEMSDRVAHADPPDIAGQVKLRACVEMANALLPYDYFDVLRNGDLVHEHTIIVDEDAD